MRTGRSGAGVAIGWCAPFHDIARCSASTAAPNGSGAAGVIGSLGVAARRRSTIISRRRCRAQRGGGPGGRGCGSLRPRPGAAPYPGARPPSGRGHRGRRDHRLGKGVGDVAGPAHGFRHQVVGVSRAVSPRCAPCSPATCTASSACSAAALINVLIGFPTMPLLGTKVSLPGTRPGTPPGPVARFGPPLATRWSWWPEPRPAGSGNGNERDRDRDRDRVQRPPRVAPVRPRPPRPQRAVEQLGVAEAAAQLAFQPGDRVQVLRRAGVLVGRADAKRGSVAADRVGHRDELLDRERAGRLAADDARPTANPRRRAAAGTTTPGRTVARRRGTPACVRPARAARPPRATPGREVAHVVRLDEPDRVGHVARARAAGRRARAARRRLGGRARRPSPRRRPCAWTAYINDAGEASLATTASKVAWPGRHRRRRRRPATRARRPTTASTTCARSSQRTAPAAYDAKIPGSVSPARRAPTCARRCGARRRRRRPRSGTVAARRCERPPLRGRHLDVDDDGHVARRHLRVDGGAVPGVPGIDREPHRVLPL